MPARKMRVELFDGEGNKYTVAFEGQMTREKALRLLDLVELLGGAPGDTGAVGANPTLSGGDSSKCERIRVLIQRNLPIAWFSSKDVQSTYEQEFKEPIGISTVATYLARMTSKGVLVKAGTSNRLKYKLAPSFPETMLRQRVP
jgi:hypothetical protein